MPEKWLCLDINKYVDAKECEACNQELDCGCCTHIIGNEAPFTCEMCGYIQIDIKDMGIVCLPPDTGPEEVEQIRKDAIKNPNKYLRC